MDCEPDRFVQEIRQYGVTVVSYTWAMLREVVDDPAFVLHGNHPVRLFIGSGMPTGLWERVVDAFAPAHVVEFFATTDGQAVLANVSGVKIGSKGRPLPGAGRVELGAYDAEQDLILEDERGFVQVAEPNEIGVLLAQSHGPIDPTRLGQTRRLRPGRHLDIDRVPVLPRRRRGLLVGRQARHGGAAPRAGWSSRSRSPTRSACISGVDLAVTYNVPVGDRQVAVSAVTLRPGATITAADLTEAVANMPIGLGPDIVQVVPEMNVERDIPPHRQRPAGGRDPQVWASGLVFRRRKQRVPPADAGGADRAERGEADAMLDDALLSILVCPADRGPLLLVDEGRESLQPAVAACIPHRGRHPGPAGRRGPRRRRRRARPAHGARPSGRSPVR